MTQSPLPPYDVGDNTTVTLTAVADPGWRFSGWSGDLVSTNNPATITMNADKTVTANFAPTYVLTMAFSPAGSGTATDMTGAPNYLAGASVSIKAVAFTGYRFVNWTAPAGTFANASAAETTFTMPAQAVTVTANFARTYALTMAVLPNDGAGTATDMTGAPNYLAGASVSIKAVAAAGYRFDKWTAPAGTFANASAAETTFTMPSQAVTVTANFARTYALTMAVLPNGTAVRRPI